MTITYKLSGMPYRDRKSDMANKTEKILSERSETHGDFKQHAYYTQTMKGLIPPVTELNDRQLEALEMIMHKIGRILAGNPNHQDHWDDIAGYATLGSNACED